MNLIVIGSVAYDSIETPFGKAERALGGSASYFSLAASLFTTPGLVGVVGEDFETKDRQTLADHGVDLQGLSVLPGKTFFWSGKYDFDLNKRTTLITDLNVLQDFSPELPEEFIQAPYVFLGNIHPELQKKVVEQASGAQFIGLDTMNYWIEKTPEELREALRVIHCFIINDSEARELSGEANIYKAAKIILGMMKQESTASPSATASGTPPKERGGIPQPTLIIKRGEYGVIMFQGEKFFNLPGYPLEEVIDPTGAGDSFAGGFMGYLAAANDTSWESLKKACVAGSAAASFCVGKMGTAGLLHITQDQMQQRVQEFKKVTEF